MPSTAESPARSTRRNITGVIARHEAGSIDVCKRDDQVSLHCSTRQGVVIITVDLKEFVLKCRGRRDHNLNTLPSVEDFAPKAEGERREAGGERPAPAARPRARSAGSGRAMDPAALARYQIAIAAYMRGEFTTKIAAAEAHGITGAAYYRFISWARHNSSAPRAPRSAEPLTDGDRPFILKPGGKAL